MSGCIILPEYPDNRQHPLPGGRARRLGFANGAWPPKFNLTGPNRLTRWDLPWRAPPMAFEGGHAPPPPRLGRLSLANLIGPI